MAMKIKSGELRGKKTEELIKMRKKMQLHLMKNPKSAETGTLDKGFNPKEERQNVARINTILKERKNG